MAALLLSTFAVASCAAAIGDDCKYDVDCSQNLNRTCDRGQPGGYCLIIGCIPDECPSESVCVDFITPCPEGMDEESCLRIEPNRRRTYCLKHCNSDGDCRSKYTCADPAVLEAEVIDIDPGGSNICVPDD